MSNKKQQIPAIRFKGFTDTWEQRKFFDNIQNTIDFRGRTPKKLGMDWSESGYLALSALNVKNGYIDPSADAHYGDGELYKKWMGGRELRKGQVLFTTEAPMGNVAQVPDNQGYILSQRTITFDVNDEKITDDFLAVLLRSPNVFNDLSALASGGTAKGVSQKSLSGLKVIVPRNLCEQEKIGLFFKQLDSAIALHQRQLNDYKQLKKSMLQNMFPQEGETIPKVRFDGFTEEWKQCKLKDAVNGDISDGDWIEKEHIHDEGVYRIIQTGNLGVGTYIDKKDTAKFMNQSSFDTLKANEIYPGDILISRLADPAGRTIVLPESSYRMVTAVDVTVIRPNENFDADFFVAEMNSEKNLNEVAKQVSGTSHKRISRKNLENVEINVTSLAEQKQIGAFFKTLEDTIVLHQQKISNYQALKSTFLRKMFM